MAEATLLVELLTEELPPKSLPQLGRTFAELLAADLASDGFLQSDSETRWYATPRRLAVSVTKVRETAPDREVLVKGPAVRSALDKEGKPTKALLGFSNKRGVPVDRLERINDGKQDVFAHRDMVRGNQLGPTLDIKVAAALERLPVAKMMRWGDGDAQFVRPVHGLVMLHGTRVVPGTVLGLESGRATRGHRFLGAATIEQWPHVAVDLFGR